MNEPALFDVPRQPSPRLAWLQRHRVRLHYDRAAASVELAAWCAWLPANDDASDDQPEHYHDPEKVRALPNDPDLCGYGRTQDDALVSMAKINGLRLWNEEGQE